jgi:hypothetical protein
LFLVRFLETIVVKRTPVMPRNVGHLKAKNVQTLQPLAFVGLYQ